MTTELKPIDQSYWVSNGHFLAGEYPIDKDPTKSEQKFRKIIEFGITSFIDLTEINELTPYSKYLHNSKYYNFPIPDQACPKSYDFTNLIIQKIDALISDGEIIYLHCWGGVGRTGTIVGCWLANQHKSGKLGYESLQEKWKHCSKSKTRTSPENAEQIDHILNYPLLL